MGRATGLRSSADLRVNRRALRTVTGIHHCPLWISGRVWTVVSSPRLGHNLNNDFWGVVAFDPNNIWAVGSMGNDPDFEPLIEKWDGSTWSPVAISQTGGVLLSVSGIQSTTERWATGNGVKANRYTGTLAEHLCTE